MSDRGLGRSDWLLTDVGVLVEAAVSSLRDEARGRMGTLRVDPVSYITTLISSAAAASFSLPQANMFLQLCSSFS